MRHLPLLTLALFTTPAHAQAVQQTAAPDLTAIKAQMATAKATADTAAPEVAGGAAGSGTTCRAPIVRKIALQDALAGLAS